MSKYFFLICVLLFAGCQSGEFTAEKCEELAMRAYQGWPKESNTYKYNCKDKVAHKITPQLCQRALEQLIVKGKGDALKEAFGDKIMGCFTQDDLKKYLRE